MRHMRVSVVCVPQFFLTSLGLSLQTLLTSFCSFLLALGLLFELLSLLLKSQLTSIYLTVLKLMSQILVVLLVLQVSLVVLMLLVCGLLSTLLHELLVLLDLLKSLLGLLGSLSWMLLPVLVPVVETVPLVAE